MTTMVKNWTEWLENSRFAYMSEEQKQQTFRWLFQVRDKVLDRANLKPNDTLIDIGCGTGLLAFGAYELLKKTGSVIASDSFEDCIEECKKIAEQSEIKENLKFLLSDAANIKLPVNSVDVVVMRSVLVHILEKQPVIDECYRILKQGGRISIFEPIINTNTRYNELVDKENFPNFKRFKEVEDHLMSLPSDPLTNFNDKSLQDNFIKAGFKNIDINLNTEKSVYKASASMVESWFNIQPSPGKPTLKQNFLKHLNEEEMDKYIEAIKTDLDDKEITVTTYSAYISATK